MLVINRFANFTFTPQVRQALLIPENKSLLFYTSLNERIPYNESTMRDHGGNGTYYFNVGIRPLNLVND
jgi:hypothetical protein